MKRIAWLTDIHLDFLDAYEIDAFCQDIASTDFDAALIGGDIGNAKTTKGLLTLLERRLQRPIYFVLGNHDFYGGSIAGVRAAMAELCTASHWLRWLAASGPIALSETTGLVGHGCWADGRLGNAARSRVQFNDYFYIEEFIGLSQRQRFARLNALGDECAEHVRLALSAALARFQHVLLLAHVPPFREACWYQGRTSGDEFLPHVACSVAGDAMVGIMRRYSGCDLTVLCGHTHGSGEVHVLPNLLVKTGGAEYGRPRIQELITIP